MAKSKTKDTRKKVSEAIPDTTSSTRKGSEAIPHTSKGKRASKAFPFQLLCKVGTPESSSKKKEH